MIYHERMVRHPAVSGQFYPDSARALSAAVDALTRDDAERLPARAVVAPHAGYVYSGGVAGEVYSSVSLPERYVIFCPNHTGVGADAAIVPSGAWRMPWGEVPVDEPLARLLMEASPLLADDPSAHRHEHSLEVQLPFIHRFRKSFRFVPVALGHLSPARCRELGEAVAGVLSGEADPPLLVASSDMSHYEPDTVARRKDALAIERMLALDPEGLYRTVRAERIGMCGFIPATVVLHAALSLGATSARLIKYATSGDAGGDYARVVGYAGLAFL